MQKTDEVLPSEIGRVNDHDIMIKWKDGHKSEFDSRELRIACPCANCVEEMTGKNLINPSLIPEDIHPVKVHLVGRYAIRIDWSDSHNTGIYTFEKLRNLG